MQNIPRKALRELDPTREIERAVEAHINRQAKASEVFEAADRVLGGFGVEALAVRQDVILEGRTPHTLRYVNRGDAWDLTLMRLDGRWAVGCWGHVVETHPSWFA